jgi:hypothetical protein
VADLLQLSFPAVHSFLSWTLDRIMKLRFYSPILLALVALLQGAHAFGRNDKVLLSKVKTLTLRNGMKTTARRLSPIPQLKCIGGDAKVTSFHGPSDAAVANGWFFRGCMKSM